MSYLSEQVGLMKLQLFKMKKRMKLKKQAKKPIVKIKKTKEELIKLAAKITIPKKKIKLPTQTTQTTQTNISKKPKRRRRRGEE